MSIGSDAVEAAEQYYANGCKLSGGTAIEEISRVYGKQAVVVSIDPRRVYVSDPADTPHTCVKATKPGPNGERWCWWQCTVKGGREGRDVDAVQVGGCWGWRGGAGWLGWMEGVQGCQSIGRQLLHRGMLASATCCRPDSVDASSSTRQPQ